MLSSPFATRTIGLALVIVVFGVLLGNSVVVGQDIDSPEGVDGVPEAPNTLPEAVLPTAHIAVLGDSLLGSPTVSPIRSGDCRISERSAVEQAAQHVDHTSVIVTNLACPGATMTEVIRDQVPLITNDSDVIIVGGMGLEFDWPLLAEHCLDRERRSVDGCRTQANLARADAANTALLWQSFLDQVERVAPDSSIVVVAPPAPVSQAPLLMGHDCCVDPIDTHDQVRGVFELVGSLRDATIEQSGGSVMSIPTDAAFDGHRLDDPRPWLSPSFDSIGAPGVEGTAAIARLLVDVMPVGQLPPEVPITDANVALIVTPPTTPRDLSTLAAAIPGWFERFARADTQPQVQLLPVGSTALSIAATDLFADAEQLESSLASATFDAESVSLSQLAAAIADADSALDGPINRRSIVARVGRFSEEPGDADALTIAFANAVASIEITSPSPQTVVRLRELAAGTNANIRFVSATRLASALPTPSLSPAAIADVHTPESVSVTLGDTSIVIIEVDVRRPVDIDVTWLLDAQVIGVGQRLEIDGTTMGIGTHEVDVVVRGLGQEVRSTTDFLVTHDGDGFDDDDLCELTFDEVMRDIDGDDAASSCDDDDDGDGMTDLIDPCPTTPNPSLRDVDLDGLPNRCDAEPANGPAADSDGDGFPDLVDNCPTVPSTGQSDSDSDGIGGVCEDGTIDPVCTIIGTGGDDRLIGTPGDDIICAFGGNDIIDGRAGNDVIFGGPGADRIDGGEGFDVIYGGAGADELSGGDRGDVLLGERGNDIIDGDNGNDIIDGGRGHDVIHGNAGSDVLFGGSGNDTLRGDDGADTIDGQAGNDRLAGGVGADTLRGGPGRNNVRGGMGSDTLIGLDNDDLYVDGNGADLVDLSAGPDASGVQVR